MRIVQEVREGDDPVNLIGAGDLCELLGVSQTVLGQLVRDGTAVKVGRRTYELEPTVHAYVKGLRDVASGRGQGHDGKLVKERTRLARAQADAQEIKNATARGELVPADEVARTWADTLRGLRSRLLAMPSRIGADIAHLSAEDVQAIDRTLRDTLAELGGGDDED